jgi:plastocyanin
VAILSSWFAMELSIIAIALILVLGASIVPSMSSYALAQTNNNDEYEKTSEATETHTAAVSIPKGAANPEVDLTLQKVGNWYQPKETTISVGDTVTWKNEDTEGHTVTSGLGAGIQSAQTSEQGKPDGIFDSRLFKPGKSWSRTFYNPGTYNYFCTIHPWMEGVVVVNQVQKSEVPTYPVDASGSKQETWPVHTFSKDGKYDIDLKWDPVSILTGETVTFLADLYTMPANVHSPPTPYDFVVFQNGKELDRLYALTEVGIGAHKYQFSKAGPITIRIENVGGKSGAYTEFNTIVYPNSSQEPDNGGGTSDVATRVSGGTEPVSRFINPLTLVGFTFGIIFSLPAAAAGVIILYKKGKI